MISIDQWRAIIGCYVHGIKKEKWQPNSLILARSSVSLAVKITIFLLLAVHGLETNPGPTFSAAKDELLMSLDKKMKDLEERLSESEIKMQKLQETNSILKETCLTQAQKLEQLESQSRRDNIIIHNIPAASGTQETWADTEEKARKYLEEIGVEKDVKIDRAHRLKTKNKPEPIILKLNYYKDKENILEKARDAKRRRRKDNQQHVEAAKQEIFITEDYTTRVRKVRQMLRPKLEEALNANKRTFFSYDKLVIEGATYWYDDTQGVVSTKPKNLSCLDSVTDLVKI